MKDRFDDPPTVCSLTTAEFRDREATLLAQFRSAVIETEELRQGYAFRLPGDRRSIVLIAELIVAERECCPFLAFEVSALPNMGPVIVRANGPAGTKEFLKASYASPRRLPSGILGELSALRSATCKAAENDCLERRNSIRPRVSSRVAYKAERGGNELFWSPWKMYPRSQERHRNREATVYLPA